jgi:hypothetical protein
LRAAAERFAVDLEAGFLGCGIYFISLCPTPGREAIATVTVDRGNVRRR